MLVFIFRNFKKKRGTKRENSYLNFAETNLDFSVKVGVSFTFYLKPMHSLSLLLISTIIQRVQEPQHRI